jgi:hypothetical protein
MSRSKQQHEMAIVLLEALGLDTIRLEPSPDGGYRYAAWKEPRAEGSGAGRLVKRGRVVGRRA